MAAPDNPFDSTAPAPAPAGGATAPTQNAAAPAASSGKAKSGCCDVKSWSDKGMVNALRAANMFNGLALIALGVLVLLAAVVNLTFASGTIAAYLISFGIIMAVVECHLANLQVAVQAHCGFLFSFWGRATFLVFCATLALALGNWIGYIFGAVTLLNACFNLYCICVHPAFTSGRLSGTNNPYSSYTGGEQVMANYLKENPELARRAGAAAVQAARDNPEVARQAASGAYQAQQQQQAAPKDAENPWG